MVLGFYCETYCFVDLERARNLAAFYHTASKKKFPAKDFFAKCDKNR